MDNKEKIKQLEDQMKLFQLQIEELKKQPTSFIVDKWYYRPDIGALLQFKDSIAKNWGWLSDGTWTMHGHMAVISYWELASPEIIEEYFIKEAKKRGFKQGIRVDKSCFIEDSKNNISVGSKNDCKIHSDRFKILGSDDVVLHLDQNSIYYNGKWARIIPEESKLKFGDKEVIIENKNTINCGGVTGTYKELEAIYYHFKDDHLSFGSVKFEKYISGNGTQMLTGSRPKSSPWDRPERQIKIGCTWGTMGEIKAILDACDKLTK